MVRYNQVVSFPWGPGVGVGRSKGTLLGAYGREKQLNSEARSKKEKTRVS